MTKKNRKYHNCQNKSCPHGEDGQPKIFPERSKEANKYCCKQCYWDGIRGEKMEAERYKKSFGHRTHHYYTITCDECSNEFQSSHKKKPDAHRFCSIHCASVFRGRQVRGKRKITMEV